ncbi:MAG: hypothetical protein A2927_01395 [Candidatus Komeilibacteria bacterium RIFCSPLOWO2_01_FULL_45_10]|uniref:PRC-barrel domain-containing protein n=1 Tax=Candidatus Komeilibacteria bacterium RIFCSPLOWO2_01_FULL_45_10 TaxID=1798550 RepID=A0A1G2BL77_9BACT|nr:MAG: hypothetical protein A2927_01395 [Candidatus Komeilibacteria bacterium RIFCSPLOWO2_01_FULL_45_10]
MYLSLKTLKNLPVVTKNGQFLGKIREIEMEAETQNISRYFVASNQMVKRLTSKELIIAAVQVLSIDNEKMVVEDNLVKEEEMIKQAAAI